MNYGHIPLILTAGTVPDRAGAVSALNLNDVQSWLANLIVNHNILVSLVILFVIVVIIAAVCWYYSTGRDLA